MITNWHRAISQVHQLQEETSNKKIQQSIETLAGRQGLSVSPPLTLLS